MSLALRQTDQVINDTGEPVVDGYLYIGVYEQDPVTNPLDLFADVELTIPLANPQRTDSFGRPENDIYIAESKYSYVIKDEDAVTLEGPKNRVIAQNFFAFETIAALRAADAPIVIGSAPAIAYVAGYYAAADGGGGELVWMPNSALADNNGTIIKPTAVVGNGRWYRQFQRIAKAEEFGIMPNGTDYTARLVQALAAVDIILFGSGTYVGVTQPMQTNGKTLSGGGSSVSRLKCPAGPAQTVVEVNDTALGNAAPAVSGFVVRGLTLDGNKDNTDQPADDLDGWGFCMTNATKVFVDDVYVENCWLGGTGAFLNCHDTVVKTRMKNCGYDGSVSLGIATAFDINVCSNNVFEAEVEDCPYGLRMLDHCKGNHVKLTGRNIQLIGLVQAVQPANPVATGNIVHATFEGGCLYNTAQIGLRAWENEYHITQRDTIGQGVYVIGQNSFPAAYGANVITGSDGNRYKCIKDHQATNDNKPITGADWADYWVLTTDPLSNPPYAWALGYYFYTDQTPRGNKVFLSSYGTRTEAIRDEGNGTIIVLKSSKDYTDGTPMAPGTAALLNGKRTQISADIEDEETEPRLFGIQVGTAAVDVNIVAYTEQDVLVPLINVGTRTKLTYLGSGRGPDIDTGSTPGFVLSSNVFARGGNTFYVGGTEDITNIDFPETFDGHELTLFFDDAMTVLAAGADMDIGADFVAASGDWLRLKSMNSKWTKTASS